MRKLDGIIRLTLGLSWVFLTSSLLLTLLVLFLPFRGIRIRLCNIYGHLMSPVVLWITRAKVRVDDKSRMNAHHPAIFVSNHTSMTDIFLGMWLLPIGGVGIAKKEVGKVPFFGWAYRLSGHLLIDRGNRDKAIEGMRRTAETIRKYDMGIWMWPEGTRSKDGRLRKLKKGVVHLALATGLPVVPVIVAGAHKNWRLHSMTDFRKADVDVKILDPIVTTEWQAETLDEHLDEIWRAMADALPEDQQPAEYSSVS